MQMPAMSTPAVLSSDRDEHAPSDADSKSRPPSRTPESVIIRSNAASPEPQRSGWRSFCIIAACTSSMMMNNAFGPTVSILLPYAGRELGIAQYNLQWIVSSYAISSACLLVLFGRLADLYGRKKVWICGYLFIAVFGLGSGFAQNEIALDVLRGIQGIGGAAIIPAALGILAKAFPPTSPTRSIAFATFAAGAPLGGVFSFVLGAVFVQLTKPTWRSPLFVFSGLCLLGIALGMFSIDADEPSTEDDQRVDWIGAFLVTSGLVLVIFVLSASPTAPRGWRTPYIIALMTLGGLLLLAFVGWQHYLEARQIAGAPRTRWTAPPLMRPSMWGRARGRFAVMQVVACFTWASFACWLVWVQLYYQEFLHLSPILTMVRALPLFVVGMSANITIALIIGRVDVVYIIAAGTFLTGVANLFFAVIDPAAPYWAFGFPSALLIVLGVDFVFASGTLFIAKIVPPHEQSVAAAVFLSMTQIGTAVGLSVSTIVFNAVLTAQSAALGVAVNKAGTNAPAHAQLKAYQGAEWTGFAFGVFCTLLTVFLRGVGIVGHSAAHAAAPDSEAQEKSTPAPSVRRRSDEKSVLDEKRADLS